MKLAGLSFELYPSVASKRCLRSHQAGLLAKGAMLLVYLWYHLLGVSIFSRIRATRKSRQKKASLVFSYFETENNVISKT